MAFLKFSRLLALAAVVGGMPVIAAPQANNMDSLKAVVAEQRALMAQADSTGQLQSAFEARVHLAELSRRAVAVELLKQAAAYADSLDRPDLGAMAGRLLAKQHAGSGSYAAAYAGAVRSDSLQMISDQREAARWQDRQAMEMHRLATSQDSLLQVAAGRERSMAQAMVELQKKADSWMYGAIAALLVGLVLVIGLLYFLLRNSRRFRFVLEGLHKEVEDLQRRVSGAPAGGAAKTIDEAMKPVAAGMFRKDAPERLATLRDARKRGDNAKVLRVVTTLKPQLLGFDAERFGPLLARLKAPEASADRKQWNADLDALEVALTELLHKGTGASGSPS